MKRALGLSEDMSRRMRDVIVMTSGICTARTHNSDGKMNAALRLMNSLMNYFP